MAERTIGETTRNQDIIQVPPGQNCGEMSCEDLAKPGLRTRTKATRRHTES